MTFQLSASTVPGYQFEKFPDLRSVKTRERLSQSAADGYIAITDKWGFSAEQKSELLGISRSKLYCLSTGSGVLTQDQLTRISYVVGIYKALHILLSTKQADKWMSGANDDRLLAGRSPIDYVLQFGIPGLLNVRRLLDAARGGQ